MTIEEYLAALRRELPVGPLRKRRILRELEAHLRDSTQTLQRSGKTKAEAERLAVERLGPVADVAASFEARSSTSRRLALVATALATAAGLAVLAAWLAGVGGAPGHQPSPFAGGRAVVEGREVVVTAGDGTRIGSMLCRGTYSTVSARGNGVYTCTAAR